MGRASILKARCLSWRTCAKDQKNHVESHHGHATLSDLGWDLASCPLGVHGEVMSPPSRDWFLPTPEMPAYIDKAPRNQTAGTPMTVLLLV